MATAAIKVYMKSNETHVYTCQADVAREHAKRITTEGFWHKPDEYEDVFYPVDAIYKVKILWA